MGCSATENSPQELGLSQNSQFSELQRRRVSIENLPLETIASIFSFLAKSDCVAAALVCQRWCSPALDEVWRSLDSLEPLFALLGPLTRVEEDTEMDDLLLDLSPEVILTPATWTRFKSYASRVRALNQSWSRHDDQYEICNRLVMRALAVHPGGGLLPNLRALAWRASIKRMDNVLAFCSTHLKQLLLEVYSANPDPREVTRLLHSTAGSAATNLRTFEFGLNVVSMIREESRKDILAAICRLVECQPKMEELKLQDFELSDELPEMTDLHPLLPQLQTLWLRLNDSSEYRAASDIRYIGEHLLGLRSLALWYTVRNSNMNVSQHNSETLAPLLNIKGLEDFKLRYNGTLDLRPKDIEDMGQAWENLVSLALCSSHFQKSEDVPFSHLGYFPKSFSNLKNLLISVDTSGEIPSVDQIAFRFSNLENLAVILVSGTEPRKELPTRRAQSIAEYLVMICDPEVCITVDDNQPRFPAADLWTGPQSSWSWRLGELPSLIYAFRRIQKNTRRLDDSMA